MIVVPVSECKTCGVSSARGRQNDSRGVRDRGDRRLGALCSASGVLREKYLAYIGRTESSGRRGESVRAVRDAIRECLGISKRPVGFYVQERHAAFYLAGVDILRSGRKAEKECEQD